ncbi:MAG: hypothetical protein ACE5IR_10845, partial [bacterium]
NKILQPFQDKLVQEHMLQLTIAMTCRRRQKKMNIKNKKNLEKTEKLSKKPMPFGQVNCFVRRILRISPKANHEARSEKNNFGDGLCLNKIIIL